MSRHFRTARPLHLLSATLASLVGVQMQAVDPINFLGSPDFRIGYYDGSASTGYEFTVADLLNQGSGWLGNAGNHQHPWWTGDLSGGAGSPGIAITAIASPPTHDQGSPVLRIEYLTSSQTPGWQTLPMIAGDQMITLGPASKLRAVWLNVTGYGESPVQAPIRTPLITFHLWDSVIEEGVPVQRQSVSADSTTLYLNTAPTALPAADIDSRIEFPCSPSFGVKFDKPLSELLQDVLARPVYADPDAEPASAALFGIAIVGTLGAAGGHWEYLLPGGDPETGWTTVDLTRGESRQWDPGTHRQLVWDGESQFIPAGDEYALLLAGSDLGEARLRFVINGTFNPDGNNPALVFRIWDRTDETLNQSGGEVPTWVNGDIAPLPDLSVGIIADTAAYSSGTVDVVLGTNHAPTLEATEQNPIVVINATMDIHNRIEFPASSLIDDGDGTDWFHDLDDSEGNTLGVIITALNPDPAGAWEYDDGDGGWDPLQSSDLAVVEGAEQALFLDRNRILAFTPGSLAGLSADGGGQVTIPLGDLSFRAWDHTVAHEWTPAIDNRPGAGGIGSVSIGTATSFSVIVTPAVATVTLDGLPEGHVTLSELGSSASFALSATTDRDLGSAALDGYVIEQVVSGERVLMDNAVETWVSRTGDRIDVGRVPRGKAGQWVITVTARDSLNGSTTGEITLDVAAANHAPAYTGDGAPAGVTAPVTATLPLTGPSTAPADAPSFTAAALITGTLAPDFADADASPPVIITGPLRATADAQAPGVPASNDDLGLVITAIDTTYGTWQISKDQSTFVDIGSPPVGTGIYLDPTDLLRFICAPSATVPDSVASAALTFRAWDGSDGLDGSARIDNTVTGPQELPAALTDEDAEVQGISSVSLAEQTVDVPVLVPPAAVTINGIPATPVALAELAGGTTIPLTISTTRTGGSAAVDGMTISFSADGQQYVTPMEVGWITRDGGIITIAPIPQGNAGWWRITVHASDSLAGEASAPILLEVAPTVLNHAPAYSLGTPTPLTLSPGNTATLDLTGAVFCTPIPVATLLTGFTDADDQVQVAGYAQATVTASDGHLGLVLTGLDTAHGVWQMSQDLGTTWTTLTAPASGSGIYCDPSDQLRFSYTTCTDTAATALAAALTFNAWDGSDGQVASATPRALPAQIGGGSAVSAEQRTVVLPITIAPATVTFPAVPPALAVAGQPISVILNATTSRTGSTVDFAAATALPGSLALTATGLAGSADLHGVLTASGLAQVSLLANDRYAGSAARLVDIQVLPANTLALAAPVIPTTGADGAARFTAIGGGTPAGLANILAALAGRDATQVRAFAWNAQVQDYAELGGTQPAWLTPEHALFIVTRIDLGLDLSGVPQAMPGVLTLQPGWNFLTVPPLTSDGTTAVTAHPWSYFQVQDAAGAPLAALPRPWLWDGASYQQVDTLESGVGYWIRNPDAGGTPARRLLRLATAPVASPRLLAVRADQAAADETPPPPPGSAPAAPQESNAVAAGSCGMGNGMAGLFLLMLAALRAFFTRSGSRR